MWKYKSSCRDLTPANEGKSTIESSLVFIVIVKVHFTTLVKKKTLRENPIHFTSKNLSI